MAKVAQSVRGTSSLAISFTFHLCEVRVGLKEELQEHFTIEYSYLLSLNFKIIIIVIVIIVDRIIMLIYYAHFRMSVYWRGESI